MFVDYYAVLEIEPTASKEEILAAFRVQSMKWHPDRNPDRDTTEEMKLVNEARYILLDKDARPRYDKEYYRFKQAKQTQGQAKRPEQTAQAKTESRQTQQEPRQEQPKQEKQTEYPDYTISDDILKKWMENARKQAADLVRETIRDAKGITGAGIKAVATETAKGIKYYLIFSLIMFVLFKACHG
jgi:curved DNA-binding protein CbpA